MRKRKKTKFEESLKNNMCSYYYYLDRLIELAITSIEWYNLPEQEVLPINIRFIENRLAFLGSVVFFKDEDVDLYMCLPVSNKQTLNVYNEPVKYRAYASNSYQKNLTSQDSVIIYNNYMRTPIVPYLEMFASRLWDLDRTIDVNCRAQKTPILLSAPTHQRLSIINLYKEYDGNSPVIYGDDALKPDSIKSISTGAPFVADKIYELKCNIWNEALTFLGISNITVNKKERVVTDEVQRNQGGTVASRYGRIEARQDSVERINKMFGLNMGARYREFSDEEIALPNPTNNESEVFANE